MRRAGITDVLHRNGIINYYYLEPDSFENHQICGTMLYGIELYYRDHIAELDLVNGLLKDEESKLVMRRYIRSKIECRSFFANKHDGRFKYFFEGLRGENPRSLFAFDASDVWINCGAY